MLRSELKLRTSRRATQLKNGWLRFWGTWSSGCSSLDLSLRKRGFICWCWRCFLSGPWYFFAGFLVMLVVFLLYLLMLIFHWGWGWSALACGVVSLLIAIGAGVTLRFRIIKPLFSTTLAEFKRDREWLTHKTKESE